MILSVDMDIVTSDDNGCGGDTELSAQDEGQSPAPRTNYYNFISWNIEGLKSKRLSYDIHNCRKLGILIIAIVIIFPKYSIFSIPIKSQTVAGGIWVVLWCLLKTVFQNVLVAFVMALTLVS